MRYYLTAVPGQYIHTHIQLLIFLDILQTKMQIRKWKASSMFDKIN
jgi:hypothetical protein